MANFILKHFKFEIPYATREFLRRSFFVGWAVLTLTLGFLVVNNQTVREYDMVRNACPNKIIEAKAEMVAWGKSTGLVFYCQEESK